jgi:type II secretory pathway pseudopilin PulG
MNQSLRQAGFSFVEMIIVTSIMVVVFGSIIIAFQTVIELNQQSRVKLSAMSLANDRMEEFRSLPYDQVGVVAGFPAGTIPQNSVLSLNGYEIREAVRVDFVDDSGDGAGVNDSNFIQTDYKRIRTHYEWEVGARTETHTLVSNIVPRSIETNAGAGTIRIQVIDDQGNLLPGADVEVTSSSSTFNYQVSNPTGPTGAALFTVPADSGYNATATANIAGTQYSTSSTFIPGPANPVPTVAQFAVSEGGISTLTFQIGALSDLAVTSLADRIENKLNEPFTSGLALATSTNTSVGSGRLSLTPDGAGKYPPNGVAYWPLDPGPIERWRSLVVDAEVSTDTQVLVRLYTGSSTAYTLIPDSDLPGNSAGFTGPIVPLSELDAGLYPTTTIGLHLSTTDDSVTPRVDDVAAYWLESNTPLSGAPITLRGDKLIGTQTDGTPIYKTLLTETSDPDGLTAWPQTEFDIYTVETTGRAVAEACGTYPIVHRAGSSTDATVLWRSAGAHSARIVVSDTAGNPVPDASVLLSRAGYNGSGSTSACGQVFFPTVPNETDLVLEASHPLFATTTLLNIAVANATTLEITLTDL